ncbi:hypothetical protein [Pelagibius marinus]|uniref:hypothetical protein n=1 Tax=Pelagibius marinus TaxID=2762760 RepID=UPI001873068C|nr:hypothetical protein [Pelagibius marinus]
MSFRVLDALPILVGQLGQTINKVPNGRPRAGMENKKVMGFRTRSGKVLALDVYPENIDRVRLWIEPPEPASLAGVSLLSSKKCADLRRPELNRLSDAEALYLEVETKQALHNLLRWYP